MIRRLLHAAAYMLLATSLALSAASVWLGFGSEFLALAIAVAAWMLGVATA